jgi:ubiquinone/menaquinone biosynthesis C-methylase UbiE
LPDWVVCPLCHGDLDKSDPSAPDEIRCRGCGARYPVEGGIPVLLDKAARSEAEAHVVHEPIGAYHAARHVADCNLQYYDYWCTDLLGRLPARPYRRVVELMAGGAELARRAAGLPRPIVAIDINRALLELSRDELVPNGIIPVCGSAMGLPFRDASVDLVLIQGGLHHVRRQVRAAVKEIARCLAPGGILLASEPRNDNWLNRALRRAFYRLHPVPDEEEEDGFTRAEMSGLLDEAGLVLRQYDPFAYAGYMLIGNTDLVPFFSRMRRNWISSLLIGLDRLSAATPLARGFGWASEILAEKPVDDGEEAR